MSKSGVGLEGSRILSEGTAQMFSQRFYLRALLPRYSPDSIDLLKKRAESFPETAHGVKLDFQETLLSPEGKVIAQSYVFESRIVKTVVNRLGKAAALTMFSHMGNGNAGDSVADVVQTELGDDVWQLLTSRQDSARVYLALVPDAYDANGPILPASYAQNSSSAFDPLRPYKSIPSWDVVSLEA